MISAKIIKDLEEKGFKLEFPGYKTNDERIKEILKENNPRLNLAIPLLLKEDFDYKKIITNLKTGIKKEFNKIIIIAEWIFKSEGIDNKKLREIIKKYHLSEKISPDEKRYFYDSFKESIRNAQKKGEETLKEQIQLRGNLNLNQALSKIFSPGKMRIMEKIFNHEPLTNTELKYYYRAIRPLILAMLNENLDKYIRIIESTKKYK
jgi:hypothetical protein